MLVAVAFAAATGCTAEVTGSPTGVPVPADDGELTRKVFDEAALEGDDGVRKILVENYNVEAGEIGEVDCPADQQVKQGNTFDCTVRIGEVENTVRITVADEDGQYEVGVPEPR